MSKKSYFIKNDNYIEDIEYGYSYSKDYILKLMKEQGVNKINLVEGKLDHDHTHFYCIQFDECGDSHDESGKSLCGNICEEYVPRNGKSGCCKYKRGCYELTDNVYTLYKNGKLIKQK